MVTCPPGDCREGKIGNFLVHGTEQERNAVSSLQLSRLWEMVRSGPVSTGVAKLTSIRCGERMVSSYLVLEALQPQIQQMVLVWP